MLERRKLKLEPDWPRLRRLIAQDWGKTEEDVQAIMDSEDYLDQVEIVMAIEETLDRLQK